MKNERTSKRVAKIAGRILQCDSFPEFYSHDWLRRDKAWKAIQTVAASCLTQTADHIPAKPGLSKSDRDTIRAGKAKKRIHKARSASPSRGKK